MIRVILFLLIVIVGVGCFWSSSGSNLSSINETVVQVAKDVGGFVKSQAKTFSGALKLAWKKLFPEEVNGVIVDAENELFGVLEGVYLSKVTTPEGHCISSEFKNPTMERSSVNSAWTLSISNFPESLRSLAR